MAPMSSRGRARTAQPQRKKGQARTLSEALGASQAGHAKGAANPQDQNRQLARNAGGRMVAPKSTAQQIQLIQRQRSARRLQDALKAKAGATPLAPAPGPAKGLMPPAQQEARMAAERAKMEGQRSAQDAVARAQSGARSTTSSTKTGVTRTGSLQKITVADRLKLEEGRTYKGGVRTNTTGNENDGLKFRTFVKEGSNKEFHEYIDPKTKKRRVVGFTRRTGPAKGQRPPAKGLAA